MADTGAPWNLPYPLATDLVRDGAQAIEDLAEATATGLSNIPVLAGIGANAVQTVKTNTFVVSPGSGGISGDVPGLSVTFTPSSATSKVLVLVQASLSSSSDQSSATISLFRNGSLTSFIGNAAGIRRRVSTGTSAGGRAIGSAVAIFLDNPGTTSSVSYTVRLTGAGSGTIRVNESADTADAASRNRAASSITAIEVSA